MDHQDAYASITQSPGREVWLKRMLGFAVKVRRKKEHYYPSTNFDEESPCDLPEADEILSETIISLSDVSSIYPEWTEGSFDDFFRRRMFRVADRLRDAGRRHSRKRSPTPVEELHLLSTTPARDVLDDVWLGQSRKVLVTAIATSKLRGAPRRYALHLPDFVVADYDQAEIAKDLGVAESTVSSTRMRAAVFLQKHLKPK